MRGIPYEKEEEGVHLCLENARKLVKADSSGETVFSAQQGGSRVSLSGPSLVRLIRFADAVLPDVKEMVMKRVLRIEKEELATTFASRVLRSKMDEIGAIYDILECCDPLKVEILLPPDGKLQSSFTADKVDEVVGHIEEAVSAVKTLYGFKGTDIFFTSLERWNRWAEPNNRSV